MTPSELITYVAGGGITLILLACISYWSVNFFIKQVTERAYEGFRENLAHEVEQAIRVFREGMCEQIVLQGKKSDSLAGLYSLLIDLLRLGKDLAACCAKGEPLQIEKGLRAINDTCTAFFQLYQKESLHFSPEFCAMLDGFQVVQKEAMQGLERELYRKDASNRCKEAEIRQNWLRFEDRIAEVMENVRKEFHRRNLAAGNSLLKGFDALPPAPAPGAQAVLSAGAQPPA